MANNDEWHCLYRDDPRTARWLVPVFVSGYFALTSACVLGVVLVGGLIVRLLGR